MALLRRSRTGSYASLLAPDAGLNRLCSKRADFSALLSFQPIDFFEYFICALHALSVDLGPLSHFPKVFSSFSKTKPLRENHTGVLKSCPSKSGQEPFYFFSPDDPLSPERKEP